MAKKSTTLKRSKQFERFTAYVLNSTRVLGQSSKWYVKDADGEDICGDVKNENILGECKSYDCCAGTKFRQDNPHIPSKSFRIEVEWMDKINEEAKSVGKLPFLAFNNKFDKLTNTYIIMNIDSFIKLLNKIGWCEFSDIDEAWKAWKNRTKNGDKDG